MDGRQTDRLLHAVATGDNKAFEQLYLKTKNGVYAFLYSYLNNAQDTEDAMQTVYLKVKTNISSYKIGTNGRAWLLQIAKNLALDVIKKNARFALQIQNSKDDLFEESGFIKGEILEAMQNALAEEERRIVVLHVLWGYKHREIAKFLSCPTGTVTSKYKRAIEKLRRELKEDSV